MGWKWTGDELQAPERLLMTPIIFSEKINFFNYIIIILPYIGNCMLIIIYLGIIGWKWTYDELHASEFS